MNPIQEPEDGNGTAEASRRNRAAKWRLYGWLVIGLMAVALMLNLFDLIGPDINRVLLPVIVVAYVVYVIFRKR